MWKHLRRNVEALRFLFMGNEHETAIYCAALGKGYALYPGYSLATKNAAAKLIKSGLCVAKTRNMGSWDLVTLHAKV